MTSSTESGRRSQAVLILTHRDFDWVLDLVRRLHHPDIGIYIHVDGKTDPTQVDEFRRSCGSLPGVNYISTQYRLNWGGQNHLIASLELARRALIDRPTDVHLITGQDYPTRSADDIAAHGASGSIYLDHFPLPSTKWGGNGGLHRLQRYHPHDYIDARTPRGKLVVRLSRRTQRLLSVRRSLPDMELFGGSAYWSLPRDAMTYLLDYMDEHPTFVNRFKHTFCSDEMVPHIVLLNSPLADRVVNDDLRYIDWSEGKSSPAILNEDHASDILTSDDLFARKISHPESTKLIERLDREVHGIEA